MPFARIVFVLATGWAREPMPIQVPRHLRLVPRVAASLLAVALVQPALAHAEPIAPPVRAHAAARAGDYVVDIEAPKDLREVLRRGLDVERWKGFADLREEQLRSLVEGVPAQARSVLEALGYFSPRVEVSLDTTQRPQRVVLRVDPGEPSRVVAVRLRVLGPDGHPVPSLQARLLHDWSLGQGSVFDSGSWQAAKRNALLRLSTRRYAAAHIVGSRALVDPTRHAVRLSVDFETGPDFRFGPLSVQGLQRYPESVVRNLAPWSQGDPYSQEQLLDLQANLQNSRYFRSATVGAPLSGAHGDVLPVDVNVAEQRAQRLGFGLGYSSNTRARTQVDYGNLNLFGSALRLNSSVKVETLQQSLEAQLRFPRRRDGASYGIDAQVLHSDIQGLTTRSQSLGLQRRRTDGPIETVQSLKFINEQEQLTGGPVSSNMALMPGYTWTRRRLDSSLDPTRGNLLSAQISGGTRALLSQQNFVRLYVHALQFVPLGPKNQLILRGELGQVLSPSANGIPQQELFRAGGIGSVRGYPYQSLGVMEDGAVVGGRALFTAGIDAVHWVLPRWGAALFVDAGNAADSFRGLHPVLGYGVGVRWRSPVGLVSINLAHGRAIASTRIEFNAGVSF